MKTTKVIGRYVNGNYLVTILSDGTKIRETNADDFVASFPENFDCKISNYCDMGCPMCHENSTKDGKHGDILNAKFIDTLKPFTEIAIGGGDATSHPDLIPFLQKLKSKGVIANITVNQHHFMQKITLIKQLIDEELIYGLGVSLTYPTQPFIDMIKLFPNAVIHVINGIVTEEQLERLADNDLKVLILGYKTFRKGADYYASFSETINSDKEWLKNALEGYINRFKVVSFDNLAIEQLDVKRLLSAEEWDSFYMGDDGTKTLYVDLVEEKFARCSIAQVRYDLLDDMIKMFEVVKDEYESDR